MSASPIAEREMRFLFTFALCGLAGAIALHALARLLTCCCDAACGALPLALASADGSGGRGDDDPEAPRPRKPRVPPAAVLASRVDLSARASGRRRAARLAPRPVEHQQQRPEQRGDNRA